MISIKQLDNLFVAPVTFNGNLAIINESSAFLNQAQTNDSFSEKWVKLDNESSTTAIEDFQKKWVLELYGFKTVEGFKNFLKDKKVIIDAGCGLGYKSAWLAELAPHATVFGIDFSDAVLVAAKRYASFSNLYFLKGDIANLPFKPSSLDFILCDQVIHHTENPHKTYEHLASLLTGAGKFACYVYAKKALPRELIDDYFRTATHNLTHEQMWQFSDQLTELGKTLTELNVKFNCPDIPALGIKGGEYDVQRFIYWNFLKCFYHPKWTKQENDSCNFDWYSPSNAERYTPEEYKKWANDLGLKIDFFRSEEAGHTSIVCK
ncbi:MAG TPA: class I SAM-dependent methyltransferase [Bacteroidia bacterium]|jgi:SAM-dependent methyltransferase|nr:class I SAM-dependent methyltransferase [Bacteroidia bacterium]